MNVDIALIISFIALLCAVLSPIVTGYFRLQEKKMEIAAAQAEAARRFYKEHRAQVIENFLRTAGKAAKDRTNLGDFGLNMAEIYLYIKPELWPLADRINQAISDLDYDEASQQLIELSKKLSGTHIREQEYKNTMQTMQDSD